MTAPLLGLVMIVKNEAHGILATLDSMLPFVDCATIVDTGSTDGTQDVVRKRLESCGEGFMLHEQPFVDFSTTRNVALDLHGEATIFTFMPDADDVLVEGAQLRAFLEKWHDQGDESAYMITIRRPGSRGDLQYVLPLILRASARWRYRGRVHEYVGGPPGAGEFARGVVAGAFVQQVPPGQSYEQSRTRWARDRILLDQDIAENPEEPRWWFYLGQTHECLGNHELALRAYAARIALGGMPEEVYESKFRIAKLMEALGKPWAEVQQAYLDAHSFDPRHAEPLDAIARYWQSKDDLPLMHLFARRAAEIPVPHDAILFLDRDVYDWRAASLASTSAYYVAKRANDHAMTTRARMWATQAVYARPNDAQLRFNLSTFSQHMCELFPNASMKTFTFAPEEPFVALNPSIHYSNGRWRCVIRTTNYRLEDGHYKTPDGRPIVTRNFMAELADDFSIARISEMQDLVKTPRTDFPVHGFEDCRLFSTTVGLYCTATVCDFTNGQRQIVLMALDENYNIYEANPLTGPWEQYPQKNWMPIIGKAVPAASFLYRVDPTPIVVPRVFGLPGNIDFRPGRLRGGSQAVWVDDGWLVVVHDVAFQNQATRIYTHRFVHLDEDFQLRAMTPPFFFVRRGIEFCAGLARGTPDQLVVSFGVGDRSACLGFFSLAEVRMALETNYVI